MDKTPVQMGVSPKSFEHMFDILEAQIKIGGAGAGHTWDSPPDHYGGVAMTRVHSQIETRQGIAEDYLRLSREHLDRAKSLRLHYARLAANEGITYERIGELLGVTGAAVRMMLSRAE